MSEIRSSSQAAQSNRHTTRPRGIVAPGYARFIGRVGILAVALGVGVGFSTSMPHVAHAEGTEPSSDSAPAQTNPPSEAGPSAPVDATEAAAASAVPATAEDDLASEDSDAPENPAGEDETNVEPNDNLPTDVADGVIPGGDDDNLPADTATPPTSVEPDPPLSETPLSSVEQPDPQPITADYADLSAPTTGHDIDPNPTTEVSPLVVALDETTLPEALDLGGAPVAAGTASQFSPALSTAANSAVAPSQNAPGGAAADPLQVILHFPGAVVNAAAGVVAALLSPFLGPGPGQPGQPPVTLFAVLDWIRREIARTFFNRSPQAVANVYSTSEDIGFSGNVMTNDIDAENDPLTASVVTGPDHGELTFNADGSFTYTPDANFNGTDTFTYRISDESDWHLHGLFGLFSRGHADTATATITVTSVNDAPVSVDDSVTISEDHSAAGNLLANDTDVDSTPLTTELATAATHGTAVVNADGSYTYSPNANFNGTDTFTYAVSDGAATDTGTVSVTVTSVPDTPVAVNDTLITVEDAPLQFSPAQLLANDSDGDGDTLVTFVQAPAHGSLTLLGDGSYTYTPESNFVGIDTFTYAASDGTAMSNVATVTVTVSEVNDAPVAQPDAWYAAEDFPGVIGNVLDNDSDPENNSLTAELVSGPTNASAFYLDTDGSFTYTPAANFVGEDTFTYRASDGNGTSAVTTVHIYLGASNDDTVARDDSTTTVVDVPVTGNVLTNDTAQNPDGPTESLTVVNTQPFDTANGGAVTITANGTYTYTPAAGFTGTDTFEYTVTDGLTSDVGQVSVSVTPGVGTNIAPIAHDDQFSTTVDTPLTITRDDLLGNDEDPDGDPTQLTGDFVDQPTHGTIGNDGMGNLVYIPDAGYEGTDTFTYYVYDGQDSSNTATVTITIGTGTGTGTNIVPIAADDQLSTPVNTPLLISSGDLLDNDSDPDSGPNPLTGNIIDFPAHGDVEFNGAGQLVYTPDMNYVGTDTFTYQLSDGQDLSNIATVTIAVGNPINIAPTADDDELSTPVDAPLTITGTDLLGNDHDPDGTLDKLTVAFVVHPSHGDLTFDGVNVVYIPDAGYTGTDTFTYQAYDGQDYSNTATVTISVGSTGNNIGPVPGWDSLATAANTALAVTEAYLLANDYDAEGDLLMVIIATTPANGSLIPDGAGNYLYTPNANFIGRDQFGYVVTDGQHTSSEAFVTVRVGLPANDIPDATPDTLETDVDGILIFTPEDLLGNDIDVDGPSDLMSYIVSSPTHGTLDEEWDNNDVLTYTYTPEAGYIGTDTFYYTAYDGDADSTPTIVTITVGEPAPNTPPVTGFDSLGTAADTPLNISPNALLDNDFDVDGDPVAIHNINDPDHGTLISNAAGDFTYTPDAGFTGLDSFTYNTTDGLGTYNGNYAVVTINVGGAANIAPQAGTDTLMTQADTPLMFAPADLTGNDSDPDNGPDPLISYIAVGPVHGSLSVDQMNTTYVYTPDAGFVGTDTFYYTAFDGQADSFATLVTIVVVSTTM